MALVLNGDGAIAGLTAGGLPDASITQSDLAANIAGNGPCFSARTTGTTVSTNTNTVAPMNIVEFNVGSRYNGTGSTVNGIPAYAFQPNVAGYYQLNFGVQYQGTPYSNYWVIHYKKNGSNDQEIMVALANITYMWDYASLLVYLNGTTDYAQLNLLQISGSNQTMSGIMSAVLVRAA